MYFHLWICCPLGMEGCPLAKEGCPLVKEGCNISPMPHFSLQAWFMFSHATSWPIEWSRHESMPVPGLGLKMPCKFLPAPLHLCCHNVKSLPRLACWSQRRIKDTQMRTNLPSPILNQPSEPTNISRAMQPSQPRPSDPQRIRGP